MGLLDDAIREHLELKRLRGADPGLVAREEHDAFGPVHGDEPAEADHDVAAGEDRLAEDGLGEEDIQPAGSDSVQSEGDSGQTSEQAGETQASSNAGQETVELDMRSVLGEPVDVYDSSLEDTPSHDSL